MVVNTGMAVVAGVTAARYSRTLDTTPCNSLRPTLCGCDPLCDEPGPWGAITLTRVAERPDLRRERTRR
jgi:hypothetical protein